MFTFHTFDNGQTPPQEYLPGKAGESFVVGEAVTLADGAVTKCAAAVVPDYIALGPAGKNGAVPCAKVNEQTVYDVPLTADGAALKLGDKVTIAADGLGVTATKTGGVAQIVRMDGTGKDDIVGVRFGKAAAAAAPAGN